MRDEISENYVLIKPVAYAKDNERPKVDLSSFKTLTDAKEKGESIRRIAPTFTVKGRDWEYKNEWRQFIGLSEYCDVDGDMYFWPIFKGALREVIVGARNPVNVYTVYDSIRYATRKADLSGETKVFKATIDRNDYRIKLDQV
jgi:hypothetical protein